MDERLAKIIAYLRLPGLSANWDEYQRIARKGRFSAVRLLTHVLEEEYRIKTEIARKNRFARAKIPEPLVMETFPFDRQPKLDRKRILSLYDGFDYMTKHHNIIFMGPTGCGKTGLATAFLIQAIERGYTGRFILFTELIGHLYASVADHTEEKMLGRFESYDCLLIDEMGYVEVDPVQAGLFFTLMGLRHQEKTTFITSNLGFVEWRSFLKNDQLTAALVDRLTEFSHVVNMRQCVSLRTKLSLEE